MRRVVIVGHVVVWAGMVVLTAWAWRQSPPAPSPPWVRAGVTTLNDVIYTRAGESPLRLDVYLPPAGAAGRQARPAVIALPGGSWMAASRLLVRLDERTTFTRLAERGLVVVVVDYRQARPGAPSWPGVMDDLRESVRWVRRHARPLGVDPDRIAAMGLSSGAHLAALLGTLPDEPAKDGTSARVQAVVWFSAPFDLPTLVAFRHLDHEPARIFLGIGDGPPGELARAASPIEHVTPDDPPILLLHGTEDLWVPIEQSSRMAETLDKAGVPNRLIVVPEARHGFEAVVEYPEHLDLLPDILAFLNASWRGRAK
jgi:acetyl esterase/lipase